jgi:hypothetical protein
MILSLAFVPTFQLIDYSERLRLYFIRNCVNKMIFTIYDWFIERYLSGHSGNRNEKFWNVYERTINFIPRTSNSIEGFHRFLNSVNDTTSPNLFSLGKELINIQQCTEMFFLRSLYDFGFEGKSDKVVDICLKFGNYYDVEFLKSIALMQTIYFD